MRCRDKDALLERCYIFANIDADILAEIGAISRFERFDVGASIFTASEGSDGMRIVRQGLFRVWVGSPDGRERTLRILETHDVFGEIAMLDGLGRTAIVTAMERESSCLLIPHEPLMKLVERTPLLAKRLTEVLCERLRHVIDDIGDLSFLSLRQRLGRKIGELAFSHARIGDNEARFTRRFSQSELARYVGASREAVNKQIAILSREGIVSMNDGLIEVHDLSLLVRL